MLNEQEGKRQLTVADVKRIAKLTLDLKSAEEGDQLWEYIRNIKFFLAGQKSDQLLLTDPFYEIQIFKLEDEEISIETLIETAIEIDKLLQHKKDKNH